jgi:transaldolase/glucose-6-phosphate isomerase
MYEQFAREVQQAGFRDVLLLGMGGSSLCPEVLTLSFGKQAGFPTLAAAVERALQ